jgi:hypothetical protein
VVAEKLLATLAMGEGMVDLLLLVGEAEGTTKTMERLEELMVAGALAVVELLHVVAFEPETEGVAAQLQLNGLQA